MVSGLAGLRLVAIISNDIRQAKTRALKNTLVELRFPLVM